MTISMPAADRTTPPSQHHILVIDDDSTVAEVVGRYLERDSFAVTYACDGLYGLEVALRERPDLIVLDLMLPGLSGLEVCRRLREESDVPIVMLTALGEDADRIAGLEIGADDYVTKPFSPRELTLRVASVLRRARPNHGERHVLAGGGIVVNVGTREAWRAEMPLALTVREFDLLAYFLANPRETFGREQLLERVWGWTFGDHSTVTVHVRRLREKIEEDPGRPRLIATVWGVGYRWDGT
jgi:DNA-binding response OmpR family regulator